MTTRCRKVRRISGSSRRKALQTDMRMLGTRYSGPELHNGAGDKLDAQKESRQWAGGGWRGGAPGGVEENPPGNCWVQNGVTLQTSLPV